MQPPLCQRIGTENIIKTHNLLYKSTFLPIKARHRKTQTIYFCHKICSAHCVQDVSVHIKRKTHFWLRRQRVFSLFEFRYNKFAIFFCVPGVFSYYSLAQSLAYSLYVHAYVEYECAE